VDVRQQIAAPIAGWSASLDDLKHLLAGVTFFDGKPEERASLAPDKEERANGKIVSTWNFIARDRGVWVACHYDGTSVNLIRELPKQLRTCSVTYKPRQSMSGLPEIEKIDCK
jgi:hypothetical protein